MEVRLTLEAEVWPDDSGDHRLPEWKDFAGLWRFCDGGFRQVFNIPVGVNSVTLTLVDAKDAIHEDDIPLGYRCSLDGDQFSIERLLSNEDVTFVDLYCEAMDALEWYDFKQFYANVTWEEVPCTSDS